MELRRLRHKESRTGHKDLLLTFSAIRPFLAQARAIMETTTSPLKLVKPRYDNSKREPHPDDAEETEITAEDCEPKEGETLADVLRRVGGIGKAARRIIQGMDALTPNAMPDYRTRLDAAKQLRDTVEGTPDKAKPAKPKDAGAPSPGLLISRPKGKGQA